MLQESGPLAVDPLSIDRELWIGYRLYILFLLAAFAWAAVRFVKVWVRIPPFSRRLRQSSNPDDRRNWQRLVRSSSRWTGLIFIGWGLVASIHLCRTTGGSPQFANKTLELWSFAGDAAACLVAALLVVLLLYLIRWHLLLRIEAGGEGPSKEV